ncbi:MAG TPA: redoxin domain-containing protein [Gemmatimonadales bacterium]|nr:redoxin domain-containing protein [Gemmatimonadales bacterium]
MTWKRALIPLAAMPVIALLGFGLTRDARLVPSPLPGKSAPAFALSTLAGDSLRLSDLRGQVVLLNFWASWCLACIGEHPLLVAADRRWRDQGLRMVGVVYQDTRGNAAQWVRERGGDWPNVLDEGSRTAIEYGLFGVPETFFIDRRGRIVYKQIGPVSEQVLDTWIPRLLADSGPAVVSPAELQVGRSPGYLRTSPDFPATQGTTPRKP